MKEKEFYKQMGKKIRETRLLCGLSMENVGGDLNCTFQQIQKYENGSNRMPIHRIIKFCNITNTSIGDLLSKDSSFFNKSHHKSELEFVRKFQRLNNEQKNKLLAFLSTIGSDVNV